MSTEPEQQAICTVRRHLRLSLDELYIIFKPNIPKLSRSNLHRCLQYYGLSRLPKDESDGQKGKKKLKDIIVEVPEGIKIIAGASGFHQLANLDQKQRDEFINSIGELGNDDFLIIDTGAGISQNVMSFIMAASSSEYSPTIFPMGYFVTMTMAKKTSNVGATLRI